jgi:membrane protease YdiL (CAAX protease family)
MAQHAKGVKWYIIIAFVITWAVALLIYVLHIPLPESTAAMAAVPAPLMLLSLLGSFGPAIAAFVVRKWITREGFADAGLSLNLRGGWKYYLAAFFFPLLVVPVAVVVAAATGVARPDLSALATLVPLFVGSPITGLIYFGEEFGWRAYLQDRVAPGKPLPAALWTGLIWGIWHWPWVLLGMMMGGNLLGLLFYIVDSAVGSIFLGWLRTKGKSVWPAALAHGTGNMVVSGAMAIMSPVPSELTWGVFCLAGYAVLAAILVLSSEVKSRETAAA